MKICNDCKQSKPISEFHTSSRDGLRSICKLCDKERSRSRYWANVEKSRAEGAKKRKDHKSYYRQYNHDYYAKNRDKLKQRSRDYARNNVETVKATKKAHYQANRGKWTGYGARRRMREKEAFVEHVDRDVIFLRDKGICHICKKSVDPNNWHLEHIISLFNGGKHSYRNTAVSHPKCNLRKSRNDIVGTQSFDATT